MKIRCFSACTRLGHSYFQLFSKENQLFALVQFIKVKLKADLNSRIISRNFMIYKSRNLRLLQVLNLLLISTKKGIFFTASLLLPSQSTLNIMPSRFNAGVVAGVNENRRKRKTSMQGLKSKTTALQMHRDTFW